MATSAAVPVEQSRHGVITARIQSALAIALGVLVWLVVIGAGTAGFSAQVTVQPFDILRREVLGFTVAFVIAGTITGLVASATAGHRRWTVAFATISLLVIAGSVAILRWCVFHVTAPNTDWGRHEWNSAIGIMETSSMLGIAAGLVISGLVLLAAAVERRMARWQFGVLVAISVAVLGNGVLPIATSRISDLIVLYTGPNYRYLYEDSIAGPAAGAGVGALVGAVAIGMIARWIAATEKTQRPTRQPVPQHSGGPVA
jgi:hypothetical protein